MLFNSALAVSRRENFIQMYFFNVFILSSLFTPIIFIVSFILDIHRRNRLFNVCMIGKLDLSDGEVSSILRVLKIPNVRDVLVIEASTCIKQSHNIWQLSLHFLFGLLELLLILLSLVWTLEIFISCINRYWTRNIWLNCIHFCSLRLPYQKLFPNPIEHSTTEKTVPMVRYSFFYFFITRVG